MTHRKSLAARAGWKKHEALLHLLGEFWEPRGRSPWLDATEDDFVLAWKDCTGHVELIGIAARFGDRRALIGALLDCATEYAATLDDGDVVRDTLDVARKLLEGKRVTKAALARARKPTYRGSEDVHDASGAAAALLEAVQVRKRREPSDREPLERAGCGEQIAARVKAAVPPPPWDAVLEGLRAMKEQVDADDEPELEPETPTEAELKFEQESEALADKLAKEFANPPPSAFVKTTVVWASESLILLKHPEGQWRIRAKNTGLKKGDEVMAASLLGQRIDWAWLGAGDARRCVRFDEHGDPVTGS